MRIHFAKCFVAATLAFVSGSCGARDAAYTTATITTQSELARAASEFLSTVGREVSTSYLADFKSVPPCLRIINRLPSSMVASTTVLDGWGNAIAYVPSSATSPGYFVSGGPDGIIGNGDDIRTP